MSEDKFRVSSIPSANDGVVSVPPDCTVREAASLMMTHDYSQLPVMCTPRVVKGVISWKSLSYARQLRGEPELVKDCMVSKYRVVTLADNLVPTIKKINESEFVLVKDKTEVICGICTLYDIGDLFLLHTEPFIEIEHIELGVRKLLREYLTPRSMKKIRGLSGMPGNAESVDDLTFGEYILWLGEESNWDSLSLNLDRRVFLDRLKEINRIRNDLMHFRNAEVNSEDLGQLKKFGKLLRTAHKMRSK